MKKDSKNNLWTKAMHPETEKGLQYHIRVKRGDLSKYLLMATGEERTNIVTNLMDNYRVVGKEIYESGATCTGSKDGVEISVTSSFVHGGITVEEFAHAGVDTFIRIGTTGSLAKEIVCGDLIINTAMVRHDGPSLEYVEASYPAIADMNVTLALIEAAKKLGVRFHVGIGCSTSSFFIGQGRISYGGYFQSRVKDLIKDMQAAKVINFEMITATIFTLCNLFSLRSGAVSAVVANRVTDEWIPRGIENACRVGVEAVKILHQWDLDKEKAKEDIWYPSLSYKQK